MTRREWVAYLDQLEHERVRRLARIEAAQQLATARVVRRGFWQHDGVSGSH